MKILCTEKMSRMDEEASSLKEQFAEVIEKTVKVTSDALLNTFSDFMVYELSIYEKKKRRDSRGALKEVGRFEPYFVSIVEDMVKAAMEVVVSYCSDFVERRNAELQMAMAEIGNLKTQLETRVSEPEPSHEDVPDTPVAPVSSGLSGKWEETAESGLTIVTVGDALSPRVEECDQPVCKPGKTRKVRVARSPKQGVFMSGKITAIREFLRNRIYPEGYSKAQRQNLRRLASAFSIEEDGQLYRTVRNRKQQVLNEEEALEVFKKYHHSSTDRHKGIVKTRDAIAASFYWPRMTIDIEEWVERCAHCQKPGKLNSCGQELQSIKAF
ncbi:uncharacterized protein LOC114663020 [Erpetoichthys calabaricus]|uniref:uncharacterized protein LOC114663020 n=1 Tax=Erpetoichthys calabaricus TaxID=27687 RepID=UPI002233F462|nr:uncharacterized protein LOC114663020 [Erpetoichthys calabaricus]